MAELVQDGDMPSVRPAFQEGGQACCKFAAQVENIAACNLAARQSPFMFLNYDCVTCRQEDDLRRRIGTGSVALGGHRPA
ncbi:MAG: hypothetical protein ACE5DN_06385 [Flavobacteriales bacterium]